MYSIDRVDEQLLLKLALDSIVYGLEYGEQIQIKEDDFPPQLRETAATFVTLKTNGNLRGCIGALESHRSLVADVAANAYASAFSDPRFSPIQQEELVDIRISISILSPKEEIQFTNEDELLDQLRPGVDGVVLEYGEKRGTFLPAVWENVTDKKQFLDELKLKTGLTIDFWADAIRAWRYTTQVIS